MSVPKTSRKSFVTFTDSSIRAWFTTAEMKCKIQQTTNNRAYGELDFDNFENSEKVKQRMNGYKYAPQMNEICKIEKAFIRRN